MRVPGWRKIPAALIMGWAATFAFADSSAAVPERWAPIADTVFEHLTKENGLPDIVVTALAEDGDGFLWVGTQGGLARWDGYRFRTYLPERDNPHSLPAEWVQALHTDARGRLWVGTAAGGLARYDRESDRFEPIAIGPGGISHAGVEAIIDDGGGGLWVGTDGGLDHLDPDGAAISHFHHEPGRAASLPDDRVYALLRDREGAIWAGTAAGAVRLTAEGGFAAMPRAEPYDVRALFQDSAGTIWIGTRSHGAHRLATGTAAAQPVAGTEKAWIDSVTEAAPGEIWFGSRTQGILTLDVAAGLVGALRHDQKRPSSLADDTIFALHRDRAGLIWIGSYRGLSRHDSTPAAILPLFGDSERPNGISDRDVRSVHAMADGRVLLGFGAAGGIDLFDPRKGRLAAIRPDPDHPGKALPADVVSSQAEAPDGTLYIGTFRGLYRMDRDGHRIARLKIEGRAEDAGVQCLFLDESGLWVGGREDGVWRIDPATGAVRERLRGDRLTDERIRVIAPGHPGEIWIATVKGINRLDLAAGEVERILPDPRDPQALAAEFTDSLLMDREGRLWVATARGVDLLEGRDARQRPRFRHIGTAQGLPHNIVYMLLEDKKGDIWASTEAGLGVIDAQSFAVRALVKAEGVPFPDGFWSSSGDKTADGDLLFGAQGGLAAIRPDKVAPWRYTPPVVVTDIRIGGRPLVRNAARLTILPQDNSLAVEFSALDYSAPERNRYGYWLEGFDKGWIETDWTRRLASYTNLPPGDYILHLRGSNRDGLWSETALALPIHVVPSWYQTLWFRMAAILAALLAIAMLVRSRTAYLQHRQAVLETQVEDRTRALQEKSAQVTNLLDNSGQGFLSMGADLIVGPQYSAACEIMLGGSPAGRPADQILFGDDPRKADLFRHTVPRLLNERDSYKQSLLLSFLPDRIEAGELILQAAYKRLDDSHLMAVLTDITEERRLAERVEREHLRLGMIVAAVTDHRNFYGAVDAYRSFALKELPALLAGSAPVDALREISRQIHTFKGLLSQLNFAEAPPALHRLEDRLEAIQEGGAVPSMAAIRIALEALPVAAMIEPDLDVLREALGDDFLSHGQGAAPAVRISLRGALADYDKVIAQAAGKTGKRVTPLVIEGGEDVWIDSGAYEPFLRSLVHVFRNAVVHGIQESGTVTCRIEARDSMFRLVIADDGAGLDFDALRLKAIEMGLYSEAEAASLTERELADLIFRDRLSTRDRADEFAGRGIGLAAVRAEAHALGGTVTVESMRGEGTRFIFDLPRR